VIVAAFRYAGELVDLSVSVGDSPAYSIKCPICARRSSLSHHRVSMDEWGHVSILPGLRCPNRECGWYVRVIDGRAIDCEPFDVEASIEFLVFPPPDCLRQLCWRRAGLNGHRPTKRAALGNTPVIRTHFKSQRLSDRR
jgi:hypothetical protein